jgi:transposase
MPLPYSKDLREKIVNAYYSRVGSISTIAIIFNVNIRTVKKYLKIDRETGDLTPGQATGRPPIIGDKERDIIKNIVMKNNDKTLEEYCEILNVEEKILICKSTMENALKKLKFNRKKKSFFAQEQEREDVKKREMIL